MKRAAILLSTLILCLTGLSARVSADPASVLPFGEHPYEWIRLQPDDSGSEEWPSPRFGSCLAYDSHRHVIVMFGGFTGYNSTQPRTLDDTWEWNGVEWKRLDCPNRPDPRFGHSMVYDKSRRKNIIYGGLKNYAYNLCDDTWEFDGSDWIQVADTLTPSPHELRYAQACYFDERRNSTVLFGGALFSYGWLKDLWEWKDGRWSELPENGPWPTIRAYARFASDNNSGKALLFGGHAGSGYVQDSWIWDAIMETWERLPLGPNDPSPRSAAFMVFDPKDVNVVMFGGYNQGYYPEELDDTWIWDFTDRTWTRLEFPQRPSPRRDLGLNMVYDESRDEFILFGGYSGYGEANGELWVLRKKTTHVDIDIKPGSFPNAINLKARGTIPVAVFGNSGFDPSQIDPLSVDLAGAAIAKKGNGKPMFSLEDVNGDGIIDAVLHFNTESLKLNPGDTQAILMGSTYGGRKFRGVDSVWIVPN